MHDRRQPSIDTDRLGDPLRRPLDDVEVGASMSPPAVTTPAQLLRLQRLAGNQAVSRRMSGNLRAVQRKVDGDSLDEAKELLGMVAPDTRAPQRTSPSAPVQRKITSAVLADARELLAQVGGAVNLIVVPRAMSVGTAENPAICIKKDITVKWVKQQMGQPEISKDVDASVDWQAMIDGVGINTIVLHEGAFSGTKADKAAVVWHEYGHVVHGADESGNVYLYEITNLFNNQAPLGEKAVKSLVTRRSKSAYNKAVDPGKAALSAFLATNWGIHI